MLCKNDMDNLLQLDHLMPAVNLRHIEIFHAVMTTGNLTEAAVMLHTSQPTVSRELARFEKVLGLTLFERSRGRLHATVQGLRLFEEVQRSWYGLDRIVSAAESLREFRQGSCRSPVCRSFRNPFYRCCCSPFSPATRTSASTLCRKSRRCWRSGSRRSAMIWA